MLSICQLYGTCKVSVSWVSLTVEPLEVGFRMEWRSSPAGSSSSRTFHIADADVFSPPS